MPTVIAASDDFFAPGKCTSNLDGASCCAGTASKIANHLARRNKFAKLIRELQLGRMVNIEYHAFVDASLYRLIHSGIAVSKQHRAERTEIIDILIAVGIPKLYSFASDSVDRITTMHFPWALVALPSSNKQALSLFEQLFGFFK